MTDTATLMREAQAAAEAAHAAQLLATLATGATVDETTVAGEWTLPGDTDLKPWASDLGAIRATRLRLSVTVHAAPDEEPYFDGRVYGTPLTKTGKVSGREGARWHLIPSSVAEDLAHTLMADRLAAIGVTK